MEELFVERTHELIREKERLESVLNVTLVIKGKKVIIEGEPLDEFTAHQVVEAVGMGFTVKTALLILQEGILFETVNIKDHTRKKNLEAVRARVIGTQGKTKHTIEEISGCNLELRGNTIGVIGPAEKIQYAITAIANVIKGTKQSNVYHYLEKINREKKI